MIGRAYAKIVRLVSTNRRKQALIKRGVSFLAPNYIFFDVFSESSLMIDVGCGSEAELAIHFINKYGLTAYGVDPTRKHVPALKELEKRSQGRFIHIQKAVAREKTSLIFHESHENESGSLLKDHINVEQDEVERYEVEALTIKDLKELSTSACVDFLKLDLEGAEYELLSGIQQIDLEGIKQVFIEFHHHCISRYNKEDTQRIVRRIESLGMKGLTIDDHNYLFYREGSF